MTSSIRSQVSALDPEIPIFGVETMDELVTDSLTQRQLNMLLLASFAALALALAAIGIYGVMSYLVSQRTQEIGVRMALGASRSDVLKMIVLQGLRLAGAGAAIGIAASLGLTRLIARFLFGVETLDPFVFVSVPVLMTGVAVVAVWLPALRASRVDPMIALRHE